MATEYVTHARLSPSGSKRWMSCPGSVTLEAAFPNTSSGYSDAGTAMHDVAAWCLTAHRRAQTRVDDLVPVHTDGEPPRYVEFTEDMAAMVQEYVDTVRVLGIGNTLMVEQRVEFSDFVGVADQFGTADAIVLNERDGELMLIDLKTGYRFVDAEENSQLLLYALGALKAAVQGFAGDPVTAPGTDPSPAPGAEELAAEAAAVLDVHAAPVLESGAGQEAVEDEDDLY